MRALNIACGIAVLLLSLHMIHAIQHFLAEPPDGFHGAPFACAVAFAVVVDIFSFIGGCLLIVRRK
ncbi:MAG TPA: hypothetical protein VJR23_07615 [Candidatus Acidoferrales bacterium]|nr:hypothetical protein [Candidatus Acidoferrales bacterium]